MAFVDAVKYNQVKSMKGLPIGAIIPWSADAAAIPKGWAVCNGNTVEVTRYPLLYKIIGNTYGGTAGSTFRIPQLTNSAKGIVDIFQGHFNYLQGKGAAYQPEYSSRAQDPFWSLVGGADNGNQTSNSQTTWLSTIDLVGEINSPPNFLATYDTITMTPGEYFAVATYEPTKLRDFHLQPHAHGIANTSQTESEAYRRTSNLAVQCPSGGWNEGSCRINCNRTQVLRVREGELYANRSGDLNTAFARWAGPAAGGGEVRPVPGGETASGGYYPGDGRCQGDMTCASFGDTDRILFTSLAAGAAEASLSNVADHGHNSNNYFFEGQLNVVSPGIRSDISINNVAIVNSSGLNFGTITATTATASLEMIFIIRAY